MKREAGGLGRMSPEAREFGVLPPVGGVMGRCSLVGISKPPRLGFQEFKVNSLVHAAFEHVIFQFSAVPPRLLPATAYSQGGGRRCWR